MFRKNTFKLLFLLSAVLIISSCSKVSPEKYTPKDDDKSVVMINDELPLDVQPEKNLTLEKPASKPEPEKANTNTSNVIPKTQADVSNMSTKERDWFYQIKTDGTPSGEPQDVKDLISKYSGYYLGDTSKKVIYLTFDEGYENGYTPKILDILKQNNVKAAFFVTTPYINSNKEIIKRMVAEGHLVCNHSTNHPSMPSITDNDKFDKEFAGTEQAFESVTGSKMPKFFRPPMGKYSELSLYYTQKLGYKTIFWSFAYADWDVDKQPSVDYAKKVISERTHSGGIFLLHAVSKTNTEILDSVIKDWKSKGFELKSLNEMP